MIECRQMSTEENIVHSPLREGANPGTPDRARALRALLDAWIAEGPDEDSEGSWLVIQDLIERKKAAAEARFG